MQSTRSLHLGASRAETGCQIASQPLQFLQADISQVDTGIPSLHNAGVHLGLMLVQVSQSGRPLIPQDDLFRLGDNVESRPLLGHCPIGQFGRGGFFDDLG